MRIAHILGHNYNWNIEAYNDKNIGDEFIISAFNLGVDYFEGKRITPILDKCMIDLQFYGKRASREMSKGKLMTFDFHPANIDDSNEITNEFLLRCIREAINYQVKRGFKKIIIPNFYDNYSIDNLTTFILNVNRLISRNKKENVEYYMTIPFSNDIIRDRDNNYLENILTTLTDMSISFDGYYIVCENKPEAFKKLTIDPLLIQNLSKVFKVLKNQSYKTIYAYANWDAIIYLAQSDIDYISIGTYENLRHFSISRYTQDISGGQSDGFYFSEILLNMIKAKDIKVLSSLNLLQYIENKDNNYSDTILNNNYKWNIHKPDVNKNYLLSISALLMKISQISDIRQRSLFVLLLIERANILYKFIESRKVSLQPESRNYHLEIWKNHLLKSLNMKNEEFNNLIPSLKKQYGFR